MAVATSEASARVGAGAETIEFEHLRRHDHGLHGAAAFADELLLAAGHILVRDLHA